VPPLKIGRLVAAVYVDSRNVTDELVYRREHVLPRGADGCRSHVWVRLRLLYANAVEDLVTIRLYLQRMRSTPLALKTSATMTDNRMSSSRNQAVADEPVTSVLPDGDVPYNFNHGLTADEQVLAALGYKSEFRREFSLFTTFCVSFAVLGLLPSFASTLFYGMGYAGTAGMTWGWIIAMLGIQCVAMSMAELCSSMPTSGGLYYAAAVLAPPGWGPFAAWLTGWSNWLAQVTAAPSGQFSAALHRCRGLMKYQSTMAYQP
jgi:hypothetical protein